MLANFDATPDTRRQIRIRWPQNAATSCYDMRYMTSRAESGSPRKIAVGFSVESRTAPTALPVVLRFRGSK